MIGEVKRIQKSSDNSKPEFIPVKFVEELEEINEYARLSESTKAEDNQSRLLLCCRYEYNRLSK